MNVFSGEFVLPLPAYLFTVCDSFLCRRSIRRIFDNSMPRQPIHKVRSGAYVLTFLLPGLTFLLQKKSKQKKTS